jgi:hypothetical protein
MKYLFLILSIFLLNLSANADGSKNISDGAAKGQATERTSVMPSVGGLKSSKGQDDKSIDKTKPSNNRPINSK